MMNESNIRTQVLRAVTQVRPTPAESDAIARAMWREFGSEENATAAELVVVDFPAAPGRHRVLERVGLLTSVAAGVVILTLGALSISSRVTRNDDSDLAPTTRQPGDAEPLERSDSVARQWGSIAVTFDLPPGRTKESSTDNSILLGSRLRQDGSATIKGRILVAQISELSGEAFKEGTVIRDNSSNQNGITVRSVSVLPREEVEFARIAEGGTPLSFEAGMSNELDIYSLPSSDQFVIVWTVRDGDEGRPGPLLPSLQIRR